jgi:hypothetical protein
MSDNDYGLGLKVHEDSYRELEEKLAKAKAKLEEVGFRACCVLLERDEAREQRDRLAEALRDAIKHMRHSLNCPARLPDSGFACACGMEAAYHNASEALAAVKGGPQ